MLGVFSKTLDKGMDEDMLELIGYSQQTFGIPYLHGPLHTEKCCEQSETLI